MRMRSVWFLVSAIALVVACAAASPGESDTSLSETRELQCNCDLGRNACKRSTCGCEWTGGRWGSCSLGVTDPPVTPDPTPAPVTPVPTPAPVTPVPVAPVTPAPVALVDCSVLNRDECRAESNRDVCQWSGHKRWGSCESRPTPAPTPAPLPFHDACARSNPAGQFDMCIHMDVTDPVKTATLAAKTRWEEILIGDVQSDTAQDFWGNYIQDLDPSSACSQGYPQGGIDDLYVCVREADLGDPGPLAWSGPQYISAETGLPMSGIIEVNQAYDLDNTFLPLLLTHELGHFLSFGGWGADSPTSPGPWVQNVNNDGLFTGAETKKVWQTEWGCTKEEGPPVEIPNQIHWDTACLKNEIMSAPFETPATISNITLAALTDMGYTVDFSKAGPKPNIDTNNCCVAGRRNMRGLREGGHVNSPRRLSPEGKRKAIAEGKKILKKAHENAPAKKVLGGGKYIWVADQHIEMYILEEGRIFSVPVDADDSD